MNETRTSVRRELTFETRGRLPPAHEHRGSDGLYERCVWRCMCLLTAVFVVAAIVGLSMAYGLN